MPFRSPFYKRLYYLTGCTVGLLTVGLTLILSGAGYICGALCLLTGYGLFRKVRLLLEYHQHQIIQFLEAIEHKDHAFTYPQSAASPEISSIQESLQRINRMLQQAQEEVYTQDTFFRSLLQVVSEGFLVWDDQRRILFQNQEALSLLNSEPLSFVHQLYPAYPELKPLIAAHTPVENVMLRHQEKRFLLTLNIICQKENSYAVLTVKNITRTLSAQEMEAWNKLSRVLTHEIMNTISPIISLSDTLLQQREIPLKVEKGIRIISDQSKRLLQFTQSYRKLSYLPYPEKRAVSLHSLLKNTCALVRNEMEGARICLQLELPVEEVILEADSEQLQQVLLHLLRNALQAMIPVHDSDFNSDSNPNSDSDSNSDSNSDNRQLIKVSLSLSAEHQEAYILIKDNGCGIPADVKEKIFIPYFTTKKEGSGIGLALSRQIMQRHGGSLDLLESHKGETCFRITLPM